MIVRYIQRRASIIIAIEEARLVTGQVAVGRARGDINIGRVDRGTTVRGIGGAFVIGDYPTVIGNRDKGKVAPASRNIGKRCMYMSRRENTGDK